MPAASDRDRRPPQARDAAGALLRAWRTRRRMSQLELGLSANVSTRHLSFVETGRSRPSAELLMALAEVLQLPLRERNALLLAAGHAPRYPHTPLEAPAMRAMQEAIARLLAAHEPNPGIALDRHWNVVQANAAARRLLATLPPALAQPPINLFRIGLHPQGLAAHTTNFSDWGRHLLQTLVALADQTLDEAPQTLLAELRRHPTVQALERKPADTASPHALLVPCELDLHGQRLSLFSTHVSFAAARDVTLAELTVELFYPTDAASAALLQSLAAG